MVTALPVTPGSLKEGRTPADPPQAGQVSISAQGTIPNVGFASD